MEPDAIPTSDRHFRWLREILEDPDALAPPKAAAPKLAWKGHLTLLAAREKGGKALALDTPIPTPSGWTLMGDLRAGDEIFDEQGEVCRVVVAGEVQLDRPVYEVVFSDGERIVADAEHEWLTTTYKPRDVQAIRTTQEIANSLMCASKEGLRNHRIGVCDRLNLPESPLPVPPYTLGFWLGDGHSASARITVSKKDAETILWEINAEGVPTKLGQSPNEGSDIYTLGGDRSQRARNNSIQARLRSLDLINNKHIPIMYLRASHEQRMRLLRGLMDSDGYVTKRGRGNFDTTNPNLKDGVVELLRTLGFKPQVITKRATLYGKDCGETYRVCFTAYRDAEIATLPRKVNRLRERPKRLCRSRSRKVVEVTQVASVPVRCIQVDSPSRLFLAGQGFIPTHNSTLAGAAAAAVSSGRDFLGESCDPGNVLIISLEEATSSFATRLVKFGANPDRIAVLDRASYEGDLMDAIWKVADEVEPDLIIWDTLGAFANIVTGKATVDPGDGPAWTRIMHEILDVARVHGASLLLHHARKSDGKYRDSTAIGANVDVILEMHGEGSDPRVLKGVGRFEIPEIRIRLEGDEFHLLQTFQEVKDLVLDFVAKNPRCSMRDLRDGVSARATEVQKARDALLKETLILNVGTPNAHSYMVKG